MGYQRNAESDAEFKTVKKRAKSTYKHVIDRKVKETCSFSAAFTTTA
jgi:hypothetical protein